MDEREARLVAGRARLRLISGQPKSRRMLHPRTGRPVVSRGYWEAGDVPPYPAHARHKGPGDLGPIVYVEESP